MKSSAPFKFPPLDDGDTADCFRPAPAAVGSSRPAYNRMIGKIVQRQMEQAGYPQYPPLSEAGDESPLPRPRS